MVCIMNSALCPLQLDDTLGFRTGPPTIALQQCYARGSQMVREVAQRMPVLTAITVCVDVKENPVIQPKKGKPEKVGLPRVKYLLRRY